MKNPLTLALAMLLFASSPLFGQTYRHQYVKIGASIGVANYMGDLDDNFSPKFSKPGFGLSAAYRFNPFVSVRGQFFQGWAYGSDDVSSDFARNRRNLSFRTSITEFSGVLVFDFIPTDRRYDYRPPITPYIFGGVGLFIFNPQGRLNGAWIDLQPLGTEGQYSTPPPGRNYPKPYSTVQFAFPLGAGVRFAMAKKWDLEIETGFRKTFTDYLDDVSGSYPDLEILRQENPVAALMSDRIDLSQYPEGAAVVNGIRGDKTQADWYIFTAVRISYIIDWVRCPKFK